jgi:alpha-L-rhamnosidase
LIGLFHDKTIDMRLSVRKFFLIIFCLTSRVFVYADAPLQPNGLTCEYIQNPLGIDGKQPRFTWNFISSERNQMQSAYEVIVSDNLKAIQQSVGNIWSAGKVTSSQSIQVEYNGQPLKSFTRYYWRVKVYNQNNDASAWSKINFFETAMLDAKDWKAKWIGDDSKQFERDEDFYKDDRMPLFRKDFTIIKNISSARLYISGLGYYEAYFNGKKTGDHVLDPGFTTYKNQVLYVTYDITAQIKKGKNVAGIMLGNGWYNPLPLRLFGRFNLRDVQQTGRPCVKAEIHLQYNDGTTDIITTDESWKTAPGPILRNNVYLGEKYDARLEQKNWCLPNAELSAWKNVSVIEGPSGRLTAQMQPPIRVTKIIQPLRMTETGKDTFIVDMGQNFAGVARIKLRAPAGAKINLRYGEDLLADGRMNYFTTVAGQIKEQWHLSGGPGAPATAWQMDEYIAKGAGVEVWSPRFTFHAFRFVEITGWQGKPTLNEIEGLRMNSDLESNGTFACSNDMFNKLHEAIKWTFLSNVFSVQSDCPGREKMGYGADMVVTSGAYAYNFNMANFYRKTVSDFANEQQPDGGITEIAPYTGIADRGYGGESGPLGWELAFPYLQNLLYEYYGDERVIADNYEALKRQIDFLKSKARDNNFYWDISDHEALDTKPEAFSATLFYFHHVQLAAKFAGILGKKEDSVKYANLGQQIQKTIVSKYYIPHTGRFDNATQSAQIMALWYGISPDKDSSFKILMNEFERHDMHVSTGIFSTKMMFDILREQNKNDIAYTIANQKDFPGWGYMLSKGATTLWETWKYPDNAPSQNHPMFGSIDEWFYRSLLGINAAAPGFKKIIIKPQPVKELTWATGNYISVHGNIVSDWNISDNKYNLKVSIPPNTTAEIWIRCKEHAEIMENNKPIVQENGLKLLRYENGYAVIATGSGDYFFTTEFIPR